MATKHQQVREYLERLILNGDIKPGATLPGEIELSEELGVSRNTVRHALTALASDYAIERSPGRGTLFHGTKEPAATVKTVGVINSTLMLGIYPEMIHGIEDGLYHGGYTMILANGNNDHEKERQSIQRMMRQGIAGLVIEPTASAALGPDHEIVRMLNGLGLPIVSTGCQIEGLRGSYVTIADFLVGRRATEHLIAAGHRTIAYVHMKDTQAGQRRLHGYREALAAAGIPYREELIREFEALDELPEPPGAYFTRSLLTEPDVRPTAIVYFNDQIALEAYRVFDELEIHVPADISIVGVDNLEKSWHVTPELTTFDHPKYLMGKIVADLMLSQIGSKTTAAGYGITIEPQLLDRETVARPSARIAV